MAPSEYGNTMEINIFTHISAKRFMLSLALGSSLLWSPVALLAERKKPVESSNTTTQDNSTEKLLENTERMIEQLILEIEAENKSSAESGEFANNPNQYSSVSIPNIKPLIGAITSAFGFRLHPIYNDIRFHSGIDFSASEGTGVHSTGDGIVAFSGYKKGYGQKITINHGNGFKTVYAHLSKSLVCQGQKVTRGEIIALSGNSGDSTGPHLHYEIKKNDVTVNPTAYFFDEKHPAKLITTQKTLPEPSGNNS